MDTTPDEFDIFDEDEAPDDVERKFYCIADLVEVLELDPRTINDKLRRGIIRGTKRNGAWRVASEDLLSYLMRPAAKPQNKPAPSPRRVASLPNPKAPRSPGRAIPDPERRTFREPGRSLDRPAKPIRKPRTGQ